MVEIIAGEKGKGKTKYLLDKVNESVKSASGNIVYLDKSQKHMYELNNKVRLINVTDFPVTNCDEFLGFLSGIISQRLVKKLCPKCRASRNTTNYEKRIFKSIMNMDVEQIYTPVGCDECIDGYKGRIALQEVLEVDDDIRDAIVNNVRKDELRKLVYNDKQSTLIKDGLIKVLSGFTSLDEVLRVIDISSDFGDDDQDIKDTIIGKNSNQNIETL